MTNAFSLFRLHARKPLSHWVSSVFSVYFAASISVMVVGGFYVDDPGQAILRGDPNAPARRALWHMTVLASLAFGAAIAWPRWEIRARPLGRHLPGLRRGLLVGNLMCVGVVAAAMGALMARMASPVHAGAAFLIASFVMLLTTTDEGATPRLLKWLGWTAVLVAVFLPGYYARFVEAQPAATSIVLLAAVAVMLPATFSESVSTDLPATGRRALPSWSWGGSTRLWTGGLATERVSAWVCAAWYEAAGSRRMGWTGSLLLDALIMGVVVHFTGFSGFLILTLLSAGSNVLGLGWSLRYPLGRDRRRQVAFVAVVIHNASRYLAIALVLVGLSFVTPPGTLLARMPFVAWPSMLLILFALAPLAQWPVLRDPDAARDLRPLRMLADVVPFVVVLPAIWVAHNLANLGAGHEVAGIIGVLLAGGVSYGTTWLLLRHTYRSADLVTAR